MSARGVRRPIENSKKVLPFVVAAPVHDDTTCPTRAVLLADAMRAMHDLAEHYRRIKTALAESSR